MASAGIAGTPIGEILPCYACCCFVDGCDCSPATCLGCSGQGQFCCFMGSFKACKPVGEENEDKKCCVCFEGGEYCIKPTTCCMVKQQVCCIDHRCAFPCNDEVPMLITCLPCCVVYPTFGCCATVGTLIPDLKEPEDKGANEGPVRDVTDVPVAELKPCRACLCDMCSLYCECPECLGCKGEGAVCCFQEEFTACKFISGENDVGICCVCFEGGSYCVMPSTCCLEQIQCCCFDYRCAFPCTSDKVPMICTCLPCCVVYPTFGCCAYVGDLYPDLKSVFTPVQEVVDNDISKDGKTKIIKALREEYALDGGPKVGDLMDGGSLSAEDKDQINKKLGDWENRVRGSSNKSETINEIALELGMLS